MGEKRRRSANDVQRAAKRQRGANSEGKKYERGERQSVKQVKDKKLRGSLQRQEKAIAEATSSLAASEILLPETAGFLEVDSGVERTFKVQQRGVARLVDEQSVEKMFRLLLPLGPYSSSFTADGRHVLLCGRRGHVASFNWTTKQLASELHVAEECRAATYLHSQQYYAVAQRRQAYIYDSAGVELHCLAKHSSPNALSFLPHHFLLASIGDSGVLRYQDTSTGSLVAELPTRLGASSLLAHDNRTGVVHVGHARGQVSLWAPNVSQPLVRMLCHRGALLGLASEPSGRMLYTAGADCMLKVWDLRTYKLLGEKRLPHPPLSLAVSQRNLVALAMRDAVQVWKALDSQPQLYMEHRTRDRPASLAFCPFEDILAMGSDKGFASLLVPGAGEPNFDSFAANPFQNRKQRREAEVHQLLDKIQPELITLDTGLVGSVLPDGVKPLVDERVLKSKRAKKKARGKSSVLRRVRKKQKNVFDDKRQEIRNAQQKKDLAEKKEAKRAARGTDVPDALDRFARKPQ